jgi:hypothetical protein
VDRTAQEEVASLKRVE